MTRMVTALGVLVLASAAIAQSPFVEFDRSSFEDHVRQLGADEGQLEAFRRDADDGATGVAADELLRLLIPEYDAAVACAEDGDPRAALKLTELLAGVEDLYLRAHTRYHLGRVFLDGDDPERAAEIFASYLDRDRNRTPLDAEVMYFYSHSLAEVPLPDRATAALRAFLTLFPDAPERYIASATQQLAELGSQVDSPLHEIADVMKGVERRLRKTDTGEDTQTKQKMVMEQLTEIIEQIEEQEQQTSGGAGGLNRPTAPAGSSAAPPGPTRIGDLSRKSGVVDRWGHLQDREREAIESDLQTKLPGRYRKMLEEYYKKLGSGDG